MGPGHDRNDSELALDINYNPCQKKYVVVACTLTRRYFVHDNHL